MVANPISNVLLISVCNKPEREPTGDMAADGKAQLRNGNAPNYAGIRPLIDHLITILKNLGFPTGMPTT